MHRFLGFLTTLLACATVAGAQPMPRRWVIVDQRPVGAAGLAFLSNAEGFERARAAQAGQPATTFQVGGNFTTFLGNVGNNDELVIIAHGSIQRTSPTDRTIVRFGFTFGGTSFTGFGNGANEMPVPAGFGALTNVRVTMHTCYSARDPDGNGAETALTEKLRARLGAGSTVTGFQNAAMASNVCNVEGGTAAQRTAARTALQNNRALYNLVPPRNRPGATRNQHTVGDSIVKASNNALSFDLPAQIGRRTDIRGYAPPFEGAPPPPKPTLDPRDERLATEEFDVDTCLGDCPDTGCGLATTVIQGDGIVPVEVEVLGVEAEPRRVRIVWRVRNASVTVATVHRNTDHGGWSSHATVEVDGGEIAYEDLKVTPGSQVGYILELQDESTTRLAGEIWVRVPATLALSVGASGSNPARARDLRLTFALTSGAAAKLTLHDVRGRVVLQREVGAWGAGAHTITLGREAAELPAGVYGLRLEQEGRVVQSKVTLLH